jgi:hypothetical protein
MKRVKKSFPHILIAIFALGTLGACATKQPNVDNWGHGSKGDGPLAHHPQGVSHTPAPTYEFSNPAPVYQAPIAQPAPMVSNFVGCKGDFALTNRQTGQLLAHGRAVSTAQGLFSLMPNGQSGRALNAFQNQSLTFKPDCNCGAPVNNIQNVPPINVCH